MKTFRAAAEFKMAFALAADDAFLSDSRAPNSAESHAREMRSTFSHSLDPKWTFDSDPLALARFNLDMTTRD